MHRRLLALTQQLCIKMQDGVIDNTFFTSSKNQQSIDLTTARRSGCHLFDVSFMALFLRNGVRDKVFLRRGGGHRFVLIQHSAESYPYLVKKKY